MRTSSSTRLVVTILLAATVAGCGTAAPVSRTSSAVVRTSGSPVSSAPRPHASATTKSTTQSTAKSRSSRPVDPAAHQSLVDHVRWAVTSKGLQLQVFPTHAGRTDTFPSAAKRAWAEVLTDAPNAGTAGMYDQFLCHWNYARIIVPDKPSWNLEPWRPAVGYTATVDALCNPGGSEG